MNIYEIDTNIELVGVFTHVAPNTQAADPSAVSLFLTDPTGVVTLYTYPAQVVRDGVGQYHYTFTASKSGVWAYKWQGTGAVIATSPDTKFTVNPSTMIAG
jgi:hypothetical protein